MFTDDRDHNGVENMRKGNQTAGDMKEELKKEEEAQRTNQRKIEELKDRGQRKEELNSERKGN